MDIIKRVKYLSYIRNFYDSLSIKVIKGVRFSGKTTLVHQIIEELTNTTDRNHIIYIDFEDPNNKALLVGQDLDLFIATKLQDTKKYYIFFDEVQHLKNFENLISTLGTKQNCSLFLISSTNIKIPNSVELIIRPFSYKEVCNLLSQNKIEQNNLDSFIRWGSFISIFECQDEYSKRKHLEELYKKITDLDVFKRESPAEKYKFNSITSMVLANSGKDFKAGFIKDFCNLNKSIDRRILERKSVYNYVDKLENTFLISRIKRYNISDNKVLKTIEKHYCIDNGLRTIRDKYLNTSEDFYLKNVVYNELLDIGYEVYTGKTYKGEIDFVVLDGQKKCFIQVRSKLTDVKNLSDVFNSFSPIRDASPRYVISTDTLDYSHDGITHIKLEDFLLGRKALILF